MKKISYQALLAKQAKDRQIFVFKAKPKDILSFSEIDRIGRNEDGSLKGFQRHQVAPHIKEIASYLETEEAILPNAIILAFIDGLEIESTDNDLARVTISYDEKKKPGFVVDGQQRLSAFSTIEKSNFEVFVSALLCKNIDELKQQFILINSTRPLPKTLIYELLPSVDGLPEKYTTRKFAAKIVSELNHRSDSSILGQIKQHTSSTGNISDTAMQKLISNSASDGAIRSFIKYENREELAFEMVNNFFSALIEVFGPEWNGMNPRESRLRHGAGLVAMGFIMDMIHSITNETTTKSFVPYLKLLQHDTHWTSGTWHFSDQDIREWNKIQNVSADIDTLTRYLRKKLKESIQKSKVDLRQ